MQSTPNRTGRVADLELIDSLCDYFEKAARSGDAVDLLKIVEQCEPRLHGELVAALLDLDCHHARSLGLPPLRDDYLRRYPSLKSYIDAYDFRCGIDRDGPASAAEYAAGLSAAAFIGRYELVAEVGRGATGTVWKANDRRMQRVVAIKTPARPDLSEDALRRFLREGRCAARLVHNNIVRLHDAARDSAYVYLVYEFIDGRNLNSELGRWVASPMDAARICEKLAGALQFAHDRGVIHRDVKPANIMLDLADEPRLTDFGLARSEADTSLLTHEQCVIGTPAYMAPEQARGDQTKVDHRVDVYGLGAVLTALLTGRAPYEGDSHSILTRVREATEGLSPRGVDKRVPRDLDAVCQRATDPDPAKRYPNADALSNDLRRCLRGEPPVARVPNPVSRKLRRLRRRPILVYEIAVATLVVTLTASAFLTLPQSGLRNVVIEVDPPEARVAFIPIDKNGGLPRIKNAVTGKGVGSVSARLSPGMYFVVAATVDGRFHEVYRWVPSVSQGLTGSNNLYSRINKHGQLELASVAIPVAVMRDDAHLYSASREFSPERIPSGDGISGNQPVTVRPFYMDDTEFTIADARALPGAIADHLPMERESHAYTANFYDALYAAELVGKRLPTETEYEYAATAGGTQPYPWSSRAPADLLMRDFGPVGDVDFDCTSDVSGVHGLCSNVAEWTASIGPLAEGTLNDFRVVRGGDQGVVAGDASVNASSRDPLNRCHLSPYTLSPGVGFRCVRSLRPLIDFDQMK